jgi:hypothetical protein
MSTDKQHSDFDIDFDTNWDTTKEIDARKRAGDLKGYDPLCVAFYKRTKIERLLYKRYREDGRILKAFSHRNEAFMSMSFVKEHCPAGTAEKLREEVPY